MELWGLMLRFKPLTKHAMPVLARPTNARLHKHDKADLWENNLHDSLMDCGRSLNGVLIVIVWDRSNVCPYGAKQRSLLAENRWLNDGKGTVTRRKALPIIDIHLSHSPDKTHSCTLPSLYVPNHSRLKTSSRPKFVILYLDMKSS